MTCNHCGKPGHTYSDCWQREENKHTRPQSYKPPAAQGEEQAQANVTEVTEDVGVKIEYLLAGMSFPKDHSILTDPTVWIADTAATVHTTPYGKGMKES